MGHEEKRIITEESKKTPKAHQMHAKSRPSTPSLKPTGGVDQIAMDKEQLAKRHAELMDLYRLYLKVFDNKDGEALLEHLDKVSHNNFPNYGNSEGLDGIGGVLATYSKIGEQQMVAHIKSMLFRAKRGGE